MNKKNQYFVLIFDFGHVIILDKTYHLGEGVENGMENLNIDIKIFSEYAVNFIHDINEYNNQQDKEITQFKLQKLLYFVYACFSSFEYEIMKW